MKKDFRFLKVGNESIDKQEWSMFNGLRKKAESEIGNAYKENPELTKILEAWLHNRIKEEEAREKILKITGDKNITDMMIRKPGGFIPVGNEAPEEMEVKYKGYTITYFPYQKKYMVRHPNEVSGLVQKHFASVDEAKKAIDKKAIGNATGDEYNAEIQRLTKKAEKLRRMGQGRQAMEVEKQIEKLGKELHEVGNEETKAERKFGKVMGEFEEGALKTPQGKTVTDPAQAKAIAYSEADKVDNLKRARNAMNKKNPEGLKLKIDDYAEQGLSVEDVVRSLERFGYDKADIEAQKAYIKQKVSLENK